MKWSLILCFLFILVLSSCQRGGGAIKVYPTPEESTLKTHQSTFCMPIEISLSDLESKVNEKVKHHLVVNQVTENNMVLNVERAGKISLSGYNNQALISLPIKVTAQKGVKVNLFTTDFIIDVQLLSDVSIDRDWSISSQSKIHKIVWRDNPKISLLGLNFDIKALVDKEVNEKKGDIVSEVDNAIGTKLNIKKYLDSIWYKMQKPYNIIKKTGESIYLFIEPSEVSYVKHTISSTHIEVDVKCKAEFSVVSSYDTSRLKRTKLPRLNRDKKPCEGFEISLIADIYFSDLNKKINTLLNEKVANIEGYEVVLKEAHIEPSGQDLLVTLTVDGPFQGTLAGIVDLSIDTEKHKVSVSLKEFGVVDGDIELEIANIILGDFVTSELANYAGFEYAQYIEEVPQFIIKGILEGKSGDKWHPVFNEMSTHVDALEISQKGIHLQVSGKGSGRIVVDKLKMKK